MKLAAYLEKQGLSQAEFARIIGVEQPTVSRIVAGTRTPSTKLMLVIADRTKGKVKPNDFLELA